MVLALLCALSGGAGQAAERDEMLVYGRRPGAIDPVNVAVGTVYELGRADIERANARSLDEALALMPGINVRTGGDGTPRVDMRGLRTRQVKLLINGVPFNGVADGNFDPTLIPTEYISDVRILPGAGSQLFGDGALAGVINIETRRGEGQPTAELRYEAGEYGAQRAMATFSAGNEYADVFLSLGRRHRNAWDLSEDFAAADTEDGGKRLSSDSTRNNLYGVATWRPHPALELGLTVSWFDGGRGTPPSIWDDQADLFARRPRFERIDEERGYYVQANVVYAPRERWSNRAWAYITNQVTVTNRYEDASYQPTTRPNVRNTFSDETRGILWGMHEQVNLTHARLGSFTAMVDVRQERLASDCVIRDFPIRVPAPPPQPSDPSSFVLEYDYLSTNDHVATDAGGGTEPIARLTASNRPGGGVDFVLENLAGDNLGPDSYLKHVLLAPAATLDLAGLGWRQGSGSEGTIGNVNIRAEEADGYQYSLRVNFQRPEVSDALYTGETASWLFDRGTVQDFFAEPISRTGASGPDAFSAVRFRRTEPNGFWGAAEILPTGGAPGDIYNVNLQALSAVDPLAPPPPPLEPELNTGELVTDIRLCSGGGGGGAGAGLGGNRVETVPGLTFRDRLLTQNRAMEVYSTAFEYSVQPTARLALVGGAGYYHLRRDDESDQAAVGWNVGAFFDLLKATRLRATVSHKVRIPSINQLYDPDRGNPDLGFEAADSFEVGVDQQLGTGTVSASAFIQDVENFIQFDLIRERFENLAEARFSGAELLYRQRWFDRVAVRAGYTWLRSRDRSPGTDRTQQQYTPGHKLNLSVDVDLAPRWRAHANAEYVAEQYYYTRTLPLQRAELGDFTVLNVNTSYTLPGDRVSLYVGADNLLDENYEESYGIPQAGRFVYAGVRITMN